MKRRDITWPPDWQQEAIDAALPYVDSFAIIASLSLGVFLLPAAVLAFVASREALAQLPSRTATKVSLTGLAIGLSLPAVFLFALAPV